MLSHGCLLAVFSRGLFSVCPNLFTGTLVKLDSGPFKWHHLNLITSLKALSKYSHILRCWVLGFQHTNFGEMNLIPNTGQIYMAPKASGIQKHCF